MRTRLPLLVGLVVLGIAGVGLYICWRPAPPSGGIELAGYQVQSNCILATIVLTNTGSSALSFRDGTGGPYSGGPYCEVTGRVAGMETSFHSGGGGPASMSFERVGP